MDEKLSREGLLGVEGSGLEKIGCGLRFWSLGRCNFLLMQIDRILGNSGVKLSFSPRIWSLSCGLVFCCWVRERAPKFGGENLSRRFWVERACTRSINTTGTTTSCKTELEMMHFS